MKKSIVYLVIFLIVGIALSFLSSSKDEVYIEEDITSCEEEEVNYFFGFDESKYTIEHYMVNDGQFIADILLPIIAYPQIETLLANSKDQFDPRQFKSGRPFHIIYSNDTLPKGVALVYEKDPVNYTILHLSDSLYASTGEKVIETREKIASGVIESSLYITLTDQGLSQALAMEMADIYAWSIDFYRLQKGDSFEALYEERYIGDEFIGIGEVMACTFTHKGKSFEAYRFEQDGREDYYDDVGEGLRKAFLKSPLKFGRMSSGYSGRRFHPVQKRFKAHKGTDYAAPRGTPIMSTGDGTVIESRYKGGNGNYVKVRHNSTYSTQYLHMSKRAAKVGDMVKQGDVIGYVGSTGLATGPHVCYRFWKNGQQVDSRQQEFPSTDPVKSENMERFLKVRTELRGRLQGSAPVATL